MAADRQDDVRASLDGDRFETLYQRTRQIFGVQDRTYSIPPRRYPACFVGREAVAAMVAAGSPVMRPTPSIFIA